MSRLILVRHAQASFHDEDYDKLSDLGFEQSRILGEELVAARIEADRVFMGPMRRHAETAGVVADVYRSRGARLPDPIELPDLAESESGSVMAWAMERRDNGDQRLVDVPPIKGESPAEIERTFNVAYQVVTRRWVRGDFRADPGEWEDWPDFRRRVLRGLDTIVSGHEPGETVLVFTSGGPIGIAVGWALELDDERSLEMTWYSYNASCTELRYTPGRVSLRSFNVPLSTAGPEMRTYL